MTRLFRTLQRLPLETALLLAPLAYCVHQLEESAGGFRAWRGRYFPSNNPLPPEYVFGVLTALGLSLIFLFAVRRSKPTAAFVLFFYATMQLHNVIYHVGMGWYLQDYSPGTVSAVLLYVPVNVWLWHKALRAGWVTARAAVMLIGLAGLLYWAFELKGPIMIAVGFLIGVVAVTVAEWRGASAYATPATPNSQS